MKFVLRAYPIAPHHSTANRRVSEDLGQALSHCRVVGVTIQFGFIMGILKHFRPRKPGYSRIGQDLQDEQDYIAGLKLA